MGLGIGSGKGGRREGAGRKPGSRNKRLPLSRLEKLRAEMPLDRLLRRMCDPALPEEYRDKLAMAAAAYCHPRYSITSQAQPLTPGEMTEDQLVAVIARTKQEFAQRDGQPWPRLAVDNKGR
jgi:hypothetical protein